MAADGDEEGHCQRNEKKGNPGAVKEFRNQHDEHRDAGDKRAKPVDQGLMKPTLLAMPPPVHHHARLGKCERQKSADGIERDEPVRHTAKKNEKTATE